MDLPCRLGVLTAGIEQVPWEALRALLGQSVYGGRVDSVFDQQLLESFVSTLFRPASFDLNFPLCRCAWSGRNPRDLCPR